MTTRQPLFGDRRVLASDRTGAGGVRGVKVLSELVSASADNVGARCCGRVGRWASYGPSMPSGRLDFTAGLSRKRMAAGLLLTDPDQRVLLVEPADQASREIPGGCVKVDESPCQAAAREAREELVLDLSPGRLLAVDWVPPREGRAEGVMFVYDGGTLDPAHAARIVVPPDELTGWAWSDPSKAARRLPPLLARWVTEAFHARADGSARYRR